MQNNYKMRNIVLKGNAVSKQFLGVDFDVLSIGKDSMVTKMLYRFPFTNTPASRAVM